MASPCAVPWSASSPVAGKPGSECHQTDLVPVDRDDHFLADRARDLVLKEQEHCSVKIQAFAHELLPVNILQDVVDRVPAASGRYVRVCDRCLAWSKALTG